MSGVLPPLFIELKANVSDFTAKMGEARGEVDHLATKGASGMDQMATVGKAAFFGLAAAAVGFGAASLKVGVEQEEANARLTTALHNTGSAMTALSAPVEEAESKMRRFGFTNGDTTDALAKLTAATNNPAKALGDLGLAADIARARNIDLSTATDLLAKVETGHVSLLGRLGIETKDATGKTISQEEAVRKLSEMYGGQASAYAGTFAGKMATLKAEVDNVQERIGMWLIPKIEALVGVTSTAIEWADKHRAAAEALAALIGGPLVAAMGVYLVQEARVLVSRIIDFWQSAGRAAISAAEAVRGFAASMYAALGPVELIGAALGLLTGAITLNADHTGAAKHAAESYVDAIKGTGNESTILQDKIKSLTAARDAEYLATEKAAVKQGNWADVSKSARAEYDKQTAQIGVYKGRLKDLETQQTQNKTAAEDLTAAQQRQGQSNDDLATKLGISAEMVGLLADKLHVDLTKSYDDAAVAITSYVSRLAVASPQQLQLRDAVAAFSDKTADATQKASAFKSMIDLLIGSNIGAERATVDFEGAIDGLAQKLQANKDSLDAHTAAGRANIQMNEDAVEKIRNHVEALYQQTGSADLAAQALAGDTNELVRQWQQAGYTATQIKALREQYGLIPGAINTYIGVLDGPALGEVARFRRQLEELSNNPWNVVVTPNVPGWTGGPAIPARASGGPVYPGDFLVGEQGPELLHIGADGRGYVRNAGQTRAMLAGSHAGGMTADAGGATVNLNVSVTVNGSVTSEQDLVDVIHDGLLVKGQRVGSLFGSYA